MTPTLISSQTYRTNRIRIIWVQTQNQIVFGPFMTIRPDTETVNDYLLAHATRLLESLVEIELNSALSLIAKDGSLAIVPPLVYTTVGDVRIALRSFYLSATMLESVMLGDYLNSLADATLRNLFNFTQAQVNNLRTNKLSPAATIAANIRAASGA